MPNRHMVVMTVKGLKHCMLFCLYETDIATVLGEDLVTNVALINPKNVYICNCTLLQWSKVQL